VTPCGYITLNFCLQVLLLFTLDRRGKTMDKGLWSSIRPLQALFFILSYQVIISDQICMLAWSRVSDQAAWTTPSGPETNCT
jgi:hypothetical protein